MNKSYISVWNDASGTWVAAPETAKMHSGSGSASSCTISSASDVASRQGAPLKTAFMPLAMAIGVAMLPGTAAAQAVTGNGGLELCPAGVGGLGSSWGPLSSAVGFMSCAPYGGGNASGDGMSFSLNNAASTDGAWGFNSGQITARVTGYQDGHLELAAETGIYMINDVNMSGNKITALAPGDISSTSTDAVNGAQLYQRTRYFQANSPSSDPSTDARAIGTSSVASGPSSLAIGKNSSAYGANTSAIGTNSVALGAGSVASRSDAVSVGYLSADGKSQYTRQIVNVTAGAAGTDAVNVDQLNAAIASVNGGGGGDVTPNAVTYDTSASTQITLKGAGGTKITNLTAGDISSIWSTDAVNGSQLYQTNQNVTNVANNVANVAGNLANVTNVVNNIVNNGIAGSPLVVTYDTSARDKVTLGGTDHTTAVKLTNVAPGDISSASSTDAVNGAQLYATNQNVSALASNVGDIVVNLYNRGAKYFHTNSSLADSSAVGTNAVAIGGAAIASADNSVALGANSLSDRANSVSVGSAGSERQIINVANGTSATDAVNLQQLQAVAASISSSTVTGSFVAYDDSTKGSVTLKGASGSTITNLKAGVLTASSLDAVNGSQLYETNANVANVAGNVANVAGSVTYVTNTVNNIQNGGGIKYFHANSSLADSTATGADAVAIGGAANASAANSVALGAHSVAGRANAISVGATGSERQIINVAAGTQDTDAVNLAQMNTAIANASISGGGSPDAVVYDSSSHTSLTLGGVGASAPVALTNVAAGRVTSGSTDAVNGAQLYNVSSSVAAALGAGSTVNKDGTVSAPGYTISGSTYGNVGDALNALNTAAGDLVGAAKYVKVVSSAGAASASGSESVAIGGNAMATGANSLALGAGSTAKYNNSTAIGVNATTDADNTVSVGARGAEMRITHVANGLNDTDAATVAQLNALQSKLQSTQQSSGVKSLLLGAAVPVTSYIAVSSNVTGGGSTSASSDLNAMAIGPVAAATGVGALAVGSGSAAGSDASTAVGTGAGVASVASTAIGYSAIVGANSANSLAIGYNSRANSNNTMALGSFASATSAGSVALGYAAFVNQSATNGLALGLNASVSAVNGVAIGYNSVADRASAVSVGSSSKQSQITYVAAGTSGTDAVNVNQLSGVTSIIGGGAAVNSDGTIKKPSFMIGGQTYTDVGSAINAAVSTGTANGVQYDTTARTKVTLGGTSATNAVTLTNVANGVANSDAVNVAQLTAMGAAIGTSGVVTNSFVAYDDTTLGKISLKGSGGTTITNVKAGALTSTSLDAVNGSQLYQTNANVANVAGNVTNVSNVVNNITNGGGIKYFHANSTLADSSATGTNSVAIGGAASATATNSVALGANSVAGRANAVSVGAVGSERQLINVANATNGTDAVNLQQLQAMGANVNSSGVVTNSFVAYDDTSKGKVTLGGSGSTKAVTLTNVANGVANSDAVNMAQLTAMGGTIDSSGNVTNAFVAYDDTTLGKISLKGSGGTTITNVKAGALSSTSLDAVNGSQLYSTNANVANVAGNVTNLTNVVNNITSGGGIKYFNAKSTLADSSATGTNSVAIGGAASATATNSVALGANSVAGRANAVSVGAVGSERQLINVANATNGTDAVNLQQLQAMGANVNSSGVVTNSFVAYDDTSKGKVTLGGSGSTKAVTLTNVAAGVVSADAVNLGQLKQMGVTVDTSGNVTNAFVAYDDTTLGKISLKGSGGTTITNVMAGALTSASLDAVNGSQLYSTNANVTNVAGNLTNLTNVVNNITSGGGIKYFNAKSTLADSSATGTNSVAIGGAANASATNSVALGANSVAGRANAVSVGAVGSERQLINVANATNSTDAVNLQQLQAMGANVNSSGVVTNSFVAYDDTSKGKVTFGGAGSTTPVTLTNLAAGAVTSTSSDAITGSQLYQTANSVAGALGGGAAIAKDGTITAPAYEITGSTYNNVGDALAAVDTQLGDINTNFSTNLKYVKIISQSGAAQASGSESIAIGGNAMATGTNSLAIGSGATSKYDNSTAIGVNASTDAPNTVSVGARGAEMRITHVANGINDTDAATVAQLDALQSKLLQSTQQSGAKSLLLGVVPVTSYIAVSQTVTPGLTTSASNDLNAMAVGPGAAATGIGALAVGAGSIAGSDASTAVGTGAAVASVNSTAIGYSASVGANSGNSLAIGYNSRAQALNSLAIGTEASATSAGSVAIGYRTFISQSATNSMALGLGSSVSAANAVAIGYNAVADRANAVSVGSSTQQNQIINVAAGTANTDAVNLGQMNAAINAVAGGGSPNAVVYDTSAHTSVTLGNASTPVKVSNVANGVANNDAVNVAQLQAMGGTINSSGVVTNSFVAYDDTTKGSITLKGAGGTTITNVKAGGLTANSTDAVNGGQLYQTNANVANLAANVANITGNVTNTVNNIVNGGGIKYFHANSTLADSTATGANSVAIGGAANATAANSVALGANSVASRANAVSVGAVGAERQIINVANGTNGTDAVNLQQLQAMGANINSSGVVTNSFVAYDDSTKGKVTLGGAGASVPVALTNIAVGQITSGSKDAINGSQLYGTASSVASALGGTSSVGSNGNVTAAFSLDGKTYNSVASTIDALNGKIATGSTDGVVYDTSAHNKLTLGGVNSTTPVTIANLAAATSDDQAVNLAQLKAAGLNVDTSGNVTNSFVAYDNLTKGTVTFNAGGAPTQLKNVAAGTDLTDAVNFGQMQSYVAENGGGGGTTNGVSYDDASRGKVTLGGAGSTTPVTLTNVAAGSAATDAVNYSQFSSLESQVNNLANGGAGGSTFVNINTPASGGTAAVASGSDSIAIGNGASATGSESIAIGKNTVTTGNNSVAMGTGASAPNANAVALGANSTTDRDNSVSVGSAGAERQITNVAAGTQGTDAVNVNQLNSAMGNMSNSINNVDRNAAKGIAAASALNIVTPYLPGRTTLNAGVANYRGYQSVGLGVSRWNEKGTINYNLGVSTSGGNSTIVRAGIGIVLGN
jgi:autotransporter adhesin